MHSTTKGSGDVELWNHGTVPLEDTGAWRMHGVSICTMEGEATADASRRAVV